MMISGLAGARVGPAAVQRKSSVRARAGQSIRMKSSFPVRRAVELATVASAVTPGGAQNGANLRRRSVIPSSAAKAPRVESIAFNDPRPAPWYAREFDVHIALDKGLGSVMLLGATALSLYLANSGFATDFIGFWEHFHLGPKSLGLFLNAHEWVNEGLMAIFFFNVGLEIKREFAFGSLSDIKAALLPCFGALGGMIAPMGIYLACNMVNGGVTAGWAIPMATDIAFAMGVYNFFKNRMPPAVAAFLLTLATVDDLGAIAVIAVCFAKGIVPAYLAASAGICGALFVACKKKVTSMLVYGGLGVALWYALLKGGINADIAGVIAALAVPAAAPAPPGSHAHGMEEGMKPTLLDDLIHNLHPISSMLIMPLFALANCAVPVDAAALGGVTGTPVGLGIMAGLLIGKPLGIFALCYGAVKAGICEFPKGMNGKHLLTVGMLAGIGFTMSLFLIEQALVGMPAAATSAKLAILCSSGIAAVVGGVAMTRFPVYFCEIICDEDEGCRPDLLSEQEFKAGTTATRTGARPSS